MLRNQFKYIFWDNDGVLVDTERYYLQASREALAKIGIPLSDENFAEISLAGGRSVFELAASRAVGQETIRTLRAWRDNRYTELLKNEEAPPIAGVMETLRLLHGKIDMAIVTSSQKKHFDIIHEQSFLLPFFNFWLTREDYKESKPSAEPYLMALQKSGLQKDEVVVIEDSPRGLMAAKAAGLACWVIPWGHTSEQDFTNADRILVGADEIPGLIL